MSDRTRSTRRTVLQSLWFLGWGTVAAASPTVARTGNTADRTGRHGVDATRSVASTEADDPPEETDRYVGVVDRIVDGQHVVILLEDCEGIVDQLVVPVTRFDEIEEGDILLVVVMNDELLSYRHLSDRPSDCSDPGDE